MLFFIFKQHQETSGIIKIANGTIQKPNMVFCELLTQFNENDVQVQILPPLPHDGLEIGYERCGISGNST